MVCCTGTTAFPSARWEGDNGPRQTDEVGVRNLVAAVKSASPSLRRFVLVSSIGVSRTGQFPFLILNAFGVLNAKAAGEKSLQDSGLPYTILRPGRLTDGCDTLTRPASPRICAAASPISLLTPLPAVLTHPTT